MPAIEKTFVDDHVASRIVQLKMEIAAKQEEIRLLSRGALAFPSSKTAVSSESSPPVLPITEAGEYPVTAKRKPGRQPLLGGIVSGKYKPFIIAWAAHVSNGGVNLTMRELFEIAKAADCARESIDPLRVYVRSLCIEGIATKIVSKNKSEAETYRLNRSRIKRLNSSKS